MSERIVILGGAESGIGAALLAKAGGHDVFLSDSGKLTDDRRAVLTQKGIPFEEGGHSEEKILNADWVVKSPGIPDKAPLIKKLHEAGIPVISEIEFGFKHLPAGAKVIAITGTNGKTTTTLLTHHLLKSAGWKVALGGNMGTSLAGLVAEGAHDYYVLEVSSFQLDGIQTFKPNVAVLLNITPDHLDRYEYDMSKYVASKFRITQNQDSTDTFIYSEDSAPVMDGFGRFAVKANRLGLSVENQTAAGHVAGDNLVLTLDGKEMRLAINELPLIGKHNMSNVMAAVLGVWRMGLSEEAIKAGLKTFVNAPHRLELVGETEGVRFINDSKATNVDAVYYALEGVKASIIWIVGGVDKGNDYNQVMDLVKEKVKGIICLGKDNSPIRRAFDHTGIPTFETQSITEAAEKGLTWATSGNVVLLSPACASFDLFRNYEDRGDQFRAAVQQLVKNQNQHA